MAISQFYKRGSIACLVMGSLASLAFPMSQAGKLADGSP